MKNQKYGVIIFILLVLGLTLPAYGVGIIVHCTGAVGSGNAQDHSGNNLGVNSVIQWIYGNPSAPNPNKANFLEAGSLFNTYQVGVGTANQPGTFDINTNANQTSYLRVWENSGPAANAYYRTLGPYSPGDPMPTDNFIQTFRTNTKAAPPPRPTAAASNFSLSFNAATNTYLPSFTIAAADQNDPNEPGVNFETAGYNLAIRRVGDAWDPSRIFAAKTQTITETNPNNPYFIADGATQYELRAQAWNYFGGNGDADWGPSQIFVIPASGGGGGGGAAFTPVHHLTIGFVNANTLSLAWQGVNSGVDVYQSTTAPDSGYSRAWENVQGANKNDIALPAQTTFYRIVPAGRIPVGSVSPEGDTPSETAALIQYNLRKTTSSYGINVVSFPFAPNTMRGTNNQPVANVGQLVSTVNAQGGGERAMVFGFWDDVKQEAGGYLYDETQKLWREVSTNTTIDLSTISLTMHRPYQISVNQPVNFRAAGKM